jgi:hypothetical protein
MPKNQPIKIQPMGKKSTNREKINQSGKDPQWPKTAFGG